MRRYLFLNSSSGLIGSRHDVLLGVLDDVLEVLEVLDVLDVLAAVVEFVGRFFFAGREEATVETGFWPREENLFAEASVSRDFRRGINATGSRKSSRASVN